MTKKKMNATAKRSKAKPQVKRPVHFSIGDGEPRAEKVKATRTSELYETWGRPDQIPCRDYAKLGCACYRCVRHRDNYERNALTAAAMGALTTRQNERENRKDQRDWDAPASPIEASEVDLSGNGERPPSRPGGDGSGPFQRGGSSGGPLDRGDDSRGPFNRQ